MIPDYWIYPLQELQRKKGCQWQLSFIIDLLSVEKGRLGLKVSSVRIPFNFEVNFIRDCFSQ